MKVLITGAAGNVGSEVVRHLHAAGFNLRLTDRRGRGDLPARLVVADLVHREAVYNLIDDGTGPVQAIVHLGNIPNMHAAPDHQTVYGHNCTINFNVFQAAAELGVKKVVFASSVQTINAERVMTHDHPEGDGPSQLPYLPLDGDVPANPGNPYSLSKAAAEQMLRYFSRPDLKRIKPMQAVALRLPVTMSTGWFANSCKHYTAQAKGGHALLDECFAYVTSRDVARLIEKILRTDLPGYRCYMPAARSPLIKLTPQELIARFYPNVPLKKPLSELHGMIDTSRIERETGWHPEDELATMAQPTPAMAK